MLIAIGMMRDEADVAETVVRHLYAQGVDHVIVADNNSKDDTARLLARAGAHVIEDPEVAYTQDAKMSGLARMACESRATWVLPFDADEIFYPSDGGTLADFFAKLPPSVDVVEARGWDHIATPVDDAGPSPFHTITHRREHQQKLPKVAFRACPDPYVHMGNHDVNRRQGPAVRAGGLSYRHFQYRSLEQYIRKVRNGREAYEASDLHWNYGTHWRIAGAKSDAELAADWLTMCGEEDLIVDPAPVLP
jgi:hypothetical protein